MSIKLCPSISEYQHDLPLHRQNISDLVLSGADALHVEIVKLPFCDREADYSWLYREVSDGIGLQFHVMANHPYQQMLSIAKAMPDLRARSNTMIIIPFESYKQEQKLVLNDWLNSIHINDSIRMFMVASNLQGIKNHGFQAGLSLEPSSSLDSLIPGIIKLADQITLMGIPMGHEYMKHDALFLEKIRNARSRGFRVQAEGIGYADLEVVADAGANSVVLGSYVAGCDDPGYMVREIREQLAQYK